MKKLLSIPSMLALILVSVVVLSSSHVYTVADDNEVPGADAFFDEPSLQIEGKEPKKSAFDKPLIDDVSEPQTKNDPVPSLNTKFFGDIPTLGGQQQSADPQVASTLKREGENVVWSISVNIPPDAYVYSMSPPFTGRATVKVKQLVGLEAIDKKFRPDHEPKKGYDPILEQNVEKFFKHVTWTRRFRLKQGASPSEAKIDADIRFQMCDKSTCRTLTRPVSASLTNAGNETETTASDNGLTAHPFVYEIIPYKPGSKRKPVSLRAELSPAAAKAGDVVTLAVTLKIESGWHTYSTTMEEDNAGVPTSFKIQHLQGLDILDKRFRPSKAPKPKVINAGTEKWHQEIYEDEITWTRRFHVQADAAANFGLIGRIVYQVCDENSCLKEKMVPFAVGMLPAEQVQKYRVPATVAAGDNAGNDGGFFDDPEDEPAGNAGDLEVDKGEELASDQKAPVTQQGLIPFIITAVTAGFLALLTPCVFPMIPITVSFFLKQSEKEHHKPVRMATIYCLGIVFAFTCIGLVVAVFFGATAINGLANNAWLNIGIAAVLVFFAANMLGMFEIRLPSGLLTWTSGKEGAGGVMGTLFMSFTFTLVSFTCTFAFLGGLLVLAAKGSYYWPIIGMLAFSTAFASPFFFLALFPSLLKKMPKSGGWMNRVKVTMGFIELGAALKFLSVADLTWNPQPVLFDFALVMSGWMIVCIVTGLYLMNTFRLPHDSPADHIAVPQLMLALLFLGLGGYLAVGMFAAEEPQGAMWRQIAAFAPPRIEGAQGDIGPYTQHGDLRFALDYEQAIEYARKNDKPLLFDFTGVNCVNCRLMEKKMELPQNYRELKNFVLVQLYQDNIPTINDRELADQLLAKNQNLAVDWFKDVTLPAYAVVSSDGKVQLASFKGLEQNEGSFAKFLKFGYNKWKNSANKRLTARVK